MVLFLLVLLGNIWATVFPERVDILHQFRTLFFYRKNTFAPPTERTKLWSSGRSVGIFTIRACNFFFTLDSLISSISCFLLTFFVSFLQHFYWSMTLWIPLRYWLHIHWKKRKENIRLYECLSQKGFQKLILWFEVWNHTDLVGSSSSRIFAEVHEIFSIFLFATIYQMLKNKSFQFCIKNQRKC